MTLNLKHLASEETIVGKRGHKIFLRQWRTASTPKAVVVICPGFNGHSGQYGWSAEQLASAGFCVYALDLRGRGRSDGERFFVERFEDYVEDVRAVILLAKGRDQGLPVFLLGHSAGGVVASAYATTYPLDLAGLISESFAFQLPAPGFALAMISAMARWLPRVPVLKLPNKDFSRDPRIVATMNADSLIAGEKEPAATVAALIAANRRLDRDFGKITLPLLILHGDADKLAKVGGSRRFQQAAGSSDKTLKLYTGHVHDLLADLGKAQVMDDVIDWLQTRLAVRR